MTDFVAMGSSLYPKLLARVKSRKLHVLLELIIKIIKAIVSKISSDSAGIKSMTFNNGRHRDVWAS